MHLTLEAGNALSDVVDLVRSRGEKEDKGEQRTAAFEILARRLVEKCVSRTTPPRLTAEHLVQDLIGIFRRTPYADAISGASGSTSQQTQSEVPDDNYEGSPPVRSSSALAFDNCKDLKDVTKALVDEMTDQEWMGFDVVLEDCDSMAWVHNRGESQQRPKNLFLSEMERTLGKNNPGNLSLYLGPRKKFLTQWHASKLDDLDALRCDILACLRPVDATPQILLSLGATVKGLFGKKDPVSNELPLVNEYFSDFTRLQGSTLDMETIRRRMFQGGGRGITLVVGGESGSGKTIFSAYGFARAIPRLYLDFRDIDFKRADPPKLSQSIREWSVLLRTLAKQSKDQDAGLSDFLHDACRALNGKRNAWALKLVKDRLETYRNHSDRVEAVEWVLGERYNEVKLPMVLFVMDEASRSVELVHALIECRDALFPDCPAESFGLIFCGTSLEMLHKHKDGGFSIGSNPASSNVISLGKPNVDALLSNDEFTKRVSLQALQRGVYTRAFLSNARIVSKALLPYFYSFYGYQNEEDEEQRTFKQTILGSSWECMSFVPAAFFEYNELRDLEMSDKRRCADAAFRYLVSCNVGKERMSSTTESVG